MGDLIKLKIPRAAPRAGCLIKSRKSLELSSRTAIIIEFYPEKPGIEVACHIRSAILKFRVLLTFALFHYRSPDSLDLQKIPLYKM